MGSQPFWVPQLYGQIHQYNYNKLNSMEDVWSLDSYMNVMMINYDRKIKVCIVVLFLYN